MIIVLDTNCLIHILGKEAEHRWLFDAILADQVRLAVTSEIINEYEEIVNSFFKSDHLGGNVTGLLLNLPNTIRKEVYFKWQLIVEDPDDDKYVDCAVAANAEFLITDDKHFNTLKTVDFPKVICLRLEEFRKIWQEEESIEKE